MIDEILSNCKSVEYSGSHGRTALHAAAMHGDHGKILFFILTRLFDFNSYMIYALSQFSSRPDNSIADGLTKQNSAVR